MSTRKNVHRLLSGAPTLGLAVLAIWFSADVSGATKQAKTVAGLIRANLLIAISIVVAYSAAWWWTSLEGRSRRSEIKRCLNDWSAKLAASLDAIHEAPDDDAYEAAKGAYFAEAERTWHWLKANMTDAAVSMFQNPRYNSSFYSWPHPSPKFGQERNNVMAQGHARLDVIRAFIESDGWDSPGPTFWARFKR